MCRVHQSRIAKDFQNEKSVFSERNEGESKGKGRKETRSCPNTQASNKYGVVKEVFDMVTFPILEKTIFIFHPISNSIPSVLNDP